MALWDLVASLWDLVVSKNGNEASMGLVSIPNPNPCEHPSHSFFKNNLLKFDLY